MNILKRYIPLALVFSLFISVFQIAHAAEYELGSGRSVNAIVMDDGYTFEKSTGRFWALKDNAGNITQNYRLTHRGYNWIHLTKIESDVVITFEFKTGEVISYPTGLEGGTIDQGYMTEVSRW